MITRRHGRRPAFARSSNLLQRLEPRLLLASNIRSYDGSGNNLAHPEWGSTGQALSRFAPNAYGDGISTPAGASLPSAREISNFLLQHHRADDIFNQEGLSAF